MAVDFISGRSRLRRPAFIDCIGIVSAVWLVIAGVQHADGGDKILTSEDAVVERFLNQHCGRCHDGGEAQGSFDLSTFLSFRQSATNKTYAIHSLTNIRRVVGSGEMPPAEEPLPDPAARKQFLRQLDEQLLPAQKRLPESLRRLSRREYQSILCDLLGTDIDVMNLLPGDELIDGFDNVSTGLSLSQSHLSSYLEAAFLAFNDVVDHHDEMPSELRRVRLMEVKKNQQFALSKPNCGQADGAFVKYDNKFPKPSFGGCRARESGLYRCKVSLWPLHSHGTTIGVTISVGNPKHGHRQRVVGYYDLFGSSDSPREIEFTTFMNEEDTLIVAPRIPNRRTYPTLYKQARMGVAIDLAEIEGPLNQEFPSKAHARLFGKSSTMAMVKVGKVWSRYRGSRPVYSVESTDPASDLHRILSNFLPRAFRRPVTQDELSQYHRLGMSLINAKGRFEDGVRIAVVGALCSPQFLLINTEPEPSPYQLATRLSLFLGGTGPDRDLRRLAQDGALNNPEKLRDEVDRWIDDDRFDAFIQSFADQWLGLGEISATSPDRELYPEHSGILQKAMLEETRRFVRSVFRENGSILDLIGGNYTYLNEVLARHYGIDSVVGNERMQRVELPRESVRGGLLTHASLLKITADGTVTSPVRRGVYVLERILGVDVPSPPEGVLAIEPDTRGASTFREQLNLHSKNESCNRCHRRIDPIGFALEEFDPIGGYRTRYRTSGHGSPVQGIKSYRNGKKVDASGNWLDGQAFENFSEFKTLLQTQRPAIELALAKRLLVYATGRPPGLWLESRAKELVKPEEGGPVGLRTMIHRVVRTDAFLEL